MFRILLLLTAPLTLHGLSALHFQSDFPPAEFAARWSKIYDRIGPQSVALVQGNGLKGG